MLTRRFEKVAFQQVEGQMGGSLYVAQSIRRGWQFDENPIAIDQKGTAIVYYGVGTGGVALLAEGPGSRRHVDKVTSRLGKVIAGVPVTAIYVGTGEGQVRIKDLVKTINGIKRKVYGRGLGKGLGKNEQAAVASRLKAIGGPGPEYFSVYFFTFDPASWTPRWQFYAPWSPFAALLGVSTVLFALEDTDKRWRAAGLAAGVLMILASKSRMGLVGLVACTMGPRMMPLVLRSWAWAAAAGLTASLAITGTWLARTISNGVDAFKGARADSTRVRETLQRIAEERWREEAVWFGHGTVQPGPHIVEYMPIGSHHTWFGLLFVKGLVGLLAFAVPLIWQTSLALRDAAMGPRGRLPLGLCMVIVLLTFGENLEIEAYLLWPALVLLGIHARELAEARRAPVTGPVQGGAA